ncbi:hypothetical protein D3C86_1636580 [compost metagenome]
MQVEGQHQRRASGGLGAVDQIVDEVTILHHVKLKPEGFRGDRGDILYGADAHGGEREGHAEFLRRLCGQHFAIGMLHAREAGGGECYRHGHLLADHFGRQRPVGHIHQHALAQLYLRKILLIGAVGAFRPSAAIGVIEKHFWHTALSLLLQVRYGQDFAHG